MLDGARIGADDDHAPLAEVGAGGPGLLAVEQPVVAVAHGAAAQARQVGAGARLAEELAPDLLAAHQLGNPALLLLLGAVGQDGRAAHADADAEDVGRRGELRLLLPPDHALDRGGAAAAVLLGPGDAGPARVGLLLLPGLRPLDVLLGHVLTQDVDACVFGTSQLGVGLEPGAGLGAELRLFGGVVEIHGRLPFGLPLGRRLVRIRCPQAALWAATRLTSLSRQLGGLPRITASSLARR